MEGGKMEDHELHYNNFTSLMQSLEKKIRYLETTAVQLAGFSSIVQCILYQHSLDAAARVNRRWITFFLSASVSIAFFPTFGSAVWGCLTAKRQQDAMFMEQDELYRKMCSVRNGEMKDDPAAAAASGRRRLADAFRHARHKRYAYAGFVSIALLFFNLLVLYAISFVS
ncbi:hypothetical protein ABFS82_05G121900 [Erythranthe guttata]